jgi:hypothetical protein
VEAFDEEGTDRAIHQAGGEGFLGGGSAFAFDEAAWEFTRRRETFAVIAGERKEIGAGPRGAGAEGGEHYGVAILDDDGGERLFRKKSGFKFEYAITNFLFDTDFHFHTILPETGDPKPYY